MPIWLTTAIGLAGSIVGAVVANAVFDGNAYVISFGSLAVAIALVLAYRRFVQKRPLTGEGARAFPQRGIGIEGYRERLRTFGVDPDKMLPGRPGQSPAGGSSGDDETQANLRKLEDLHRAGVLTDEELIAKRALLLDDQSSAAPD
jgi:hypothetical protein